MMNEEGTSEGQEVVEQQAEQQESANKRKTLSLGDRVKVVDYLRSLVEPIVADSNSSVAAIVSGATGVDLSWQHLKYMIDDKTMAEWNLGSKIHIKSLLTSEGDRLAALEARVSALETELRDFIQLSKVAAQ